MNREFQVDAFEQAAERALRRLAVYVEESQQQRAPVVRMRPVEEIAKELELRNWIDQGGMDAERLDEFLRRYLENSTRLHHPAFASQQVAVPEHLTAIADLVNGVTNNGMAIYEMGPSAVAIELVVLDWMLHKLGWPTLRWPRQSACESQPAFGAGVLTHGGSLANLTALLAARGRIAPEAWESGTPGDLVVLSPSSCHYSNARAVSILGLGSSAVRPLETDPLERIRPEGLRRAIEQQRNAGKRVMAVVASACATASGLYDPLEEVGQICQEQKIWFHVDGAHGASAILSEQDSHLMQGIAHADSMVWDAHKMLRASTLCAAVLFRSEQSLGHLFKQKASYLFYGGNALGIDLIERTVECTKQPLGLKLFLTLAWRGEASVGRYVAEQYALARKVSDWIRARPGFEVPYAPESNIVCFRYGVRAADQIAIKERLILEGEFHISSAEVGGERYLRLTLMNPATDRSVLEAMLDRIETIGRELAAD